MAHSRKSRAPIQEIASQAIDATGLGRREIPAAVDEQEDADLLEFCSFRMPKTDKLRLKTHFRRMGLGFSSGIRMVLSEYMSRERIR